MYVIGTAGHVDHGKSTLIEALTGIDPDRLEEEKAREMTIDLGFAWMTLPVAGEPEEIGIVDVPGHRDFIENMLAGVGGIDLALFVVAADEGVMPQTREHLAILDLLQIPSGVVALTKVDLVDDPDWLELVTIDLAETLVGTVLDNAPIVPVSAVTGAGLQTLREELASALATTETRPDLGHARLPIDRVFTVSGFGTIVTGTLTGGTLRVGDTIEVQPAELRGRVRGLQTHKTKREVAHPGSRVAVNLSGIDKEQVKRGDVLSVPGAVRGTRLLDVSYRHLVDAVVPLAHNMQVKIFVGAAEVMARTRLIGARQLQPGAEGWLQLVLEEPVAVARNDRFILRRPSPGATLGGGIVLDPHPGRKHRRFDPKVLSQMETLAEGSPAELLLQHLRRQQPTPFSDRFPRAAAAQSEMEAAWSELIAAGAALQVGDFVYTRESWDRFRNRAVAITERYHTDFPLRPGIPREELRNRLRLPSAAYGPFLSRLEHETMLFDASAYVRLPEHEIRFTQQQELRINALFERLAQAGINAPHIRECREAVGDDVYEALITTGALTQLNEEVVYRTDEYRRLSGVIIDYLQEHETANAGQIRDLLGTSRKYAIALLEYLDQQHITRRRGDTRELLRRAREEN